MVELDISAASVEVERRAVQPTLVFKLRVANRTAGASIRNVMLQCQIRIEPIRRRYSAREQEQLKELFGDRARWSETLHSLLWTHASVLIPAFSAETVVSMPVPCTYDFNIAATKFFYGVEEGEAPLLLLFSGTVFFRDGEDHLQMEQIAWTKEARLQLPVSLWRSMMQDHYPASAWLRLDLDVFDRICRYKRRQGFATWEQTFSSLIDKQAEEASP